MRQEALVRLKSRTLARMSLLRPMVARVSTVRPASSSWLAGVSAISS